MQGRARRERRGGGRVDDGTVGQRVRERHAELHQVGAGFGVGRADRDRGLDVGEAAHQVGHQRGAAAPRGERRGDPLEPRVPVTAIVSAVRVRSSGRRARSRPTQLVERLGQVLVAAAGEADQIDRARRASDAPGAQHPGDRVRGLQRRDDPLELRAGA